MSVESQFDQAPDAVYTPGSQLRSPGIFIGNMWHDLVASRELAWRLMVRDINARYRQSVFGILWAFLPPLATAGIFIILNRAAVINVSTQDMPYPVFVLFGTLLWQVFVASLSAPLKAVGENRLMLARINFPREALILSGIGQVLFDFAIKLIIFVGIFVFFHLPLTWGLLIAPFAALMLILLGSVIGLFLTPIGMLYTDVASALTIVTSIWMFITPVAYPQPNHGLLSQLMTYNPVSPLLVGVRELAIQGTLSNVMPFAVISGLSLVGLLVMWIIYRVSIPILVERMAA